MRATLGSSRASASRQGPLHIGFRTGPAGLRPPCANRELRELIKQYDVDRDGKLSVVEVEQLLAGLSTAATLPVPTPPPPTPLTWDQQLKHAIVKGALLPSFVSFAASKLQNKHKNRVSLSEIVWSFLGMFTAVFALGEISLHVKELPLVGAWHARGLNLLLGSFGTIAVLLFGRPDAEAIKFWNLVVGHVVSVTVVVGVLAVMGPSVVSRALAMALSMVAQLLTDSVHPPGGALILMAEDSTIIQAMQGWFLVYPSLAWTVLVLLPIGWLTNHLKRTVKFDWPGQAAAAEGGSSSGTLKLKPA